MKILVTGGAGFIGSNFIRYILKKYSASSADKPDYKIINLDLLTYAGNLENLKDVEQNPNYKFIKGDIADTETVNEAVRGCDLIVNFAAESHVDRSILDASAFIRTNIVGTHILLEAARKNGSVRFHHVSTDEVYGSLKPKDAPFNEKTPYSPSSPYSASKAAADYLVLSYFKTFNLPVTISNCSNNYGPYQFPEKLIPLAITNLLEGKKVPVYGTGENIRDWFFVEDHCEAIDAVIHRGKIGETYCGGGNSEKTNIEIVHKIIELLLGGEASKWIEFVKDRPGHDLRYAVDISRIKNELGWMPKTKLEDGLKKTIEWYRNNESWWKKN